MNPDHIIEVLVAAGWREETPRVFRNHRHFRHPARDGRVTVALVGDIPWPTLCRLEEQAGISLDGALVKTPDDGGMA